MSRAPDRRSESVHWGNSGRRSDGVNMRFGVFIRPRYTTRPAEPGLSRAKLCGHARRSFIGIGGITPHLAEMVTGYPTLGQLTSCPALVEHSRAAARQSTAYAAWSDSRGSCTRGPGIGLDGRERRAKSVQRGRGWNDSRQDFGSRCTSVRRKKAAHVLILSRSWTMGGITPQPRNYLQGLSVEKGYNE